MELYRGYAIDIEVLPGRSRCIVTPTRQDLPILWRSALYYLSASEAVADAKRRIDRILEI
jgi:hypothetical protein